MASKPKQKAPAGKVEFNNVRRFIAFLTLLSVTVVVIAGVMNGVRMPNILYRAGLVSVVIIFLGRLVVKVMASYEEMNSGQV